jgi:dUTP pyrophosphatase
MKEVLMLKVKILTKYAISPNKAYKGDAGWDIFTPKDFVKCTLNFGEQVLVNTGLIVLIPFNSVCQIRPKSGLALSGLTVDAGIIDSTYTGELKVLLYNRLKNASIDIVPGQKIAQLIISECDVDTDVVIVDDLAATSRGCGGFGSTGMFYSED